MVHHHCGRLRCGTWTPVSMLLADVMSGGTHALHVQFAVTFASLRFRSPGLVHMWQSHEHIMMDDRMIGTRLPRAHHRRALGEVQ